MIYRNDKTIQYIRFQWPKSVIQCMHFQWPKSDKYIRVTTRDNTSTTRDNTIQHEYNTTQHGYKGSSGSKNRALHRTFCY